MRRRAGGRDGGWLDARDWVPVDAKLKSVRATWKRGGSAGLVPRQKYLECEYAYQWGNLTGTGNLTSIYEVAPGHRIAFAPDFADDLETRQKTGRSVTCFVDPDRPWRSVLNREYQVGEQATAALGAVLGLWFACALIGRWAWAATDASGKIRRAIRGLFRRALADRGPRRLAAAMVVGFLAMSAPDYCVVAMSRGRAANAGDWVFMVAGIVVMLILGFVTATHVKDHIAQAGSGSN